MELKVIVKNKIAKFYGSYIVCGNSDYTINFAFDSEWDAYETKTARFKYNGTYTDVIFTGSTCNVPVIQNTHLITVGVYAGDLHTTTPAIIPAKISILCGGGTPAAPSDDVYSQIMELLDNKANRNQGAENTGKFWKVGKDGNLEFGEGSGGSGGISTVAAKLLISVLSDGLYGSNQEENIESLKTALGVQEVVHIVTMTLTNCTSSNSDTSVTDGDSYVTTIAANDEYTLGEVSCTMGGVAQTVLNGTINIAKVTGDIAINAIAAKTNTDGTAISMETKTASGDYTAYADDGNESVPMLNYSSTYQISNVFNADTTVKIKVNITAQTYDHIIVGCANSENSQTIYYAEKHGTSAWVTSLQNEFEYTVKANHRLIIVPYRGNSSTWVTAERTA